MNNFVFSQDPILYQSPFPRQMNTEMDLKQQMDDAYVKYRNAQEQYRSMERPEMPKDGVKELNDLLVSLSPEVAEKLAQNEEYAKLNIQLQNLVQRELLESIKWKINGNAGATKNMERQIEIINETKKENEAEERRNMSELNDYMKNYSNMTFDEYKRIKNGENNEENKSKKK